MAEITKNNGVQTYYTKFSDDNINLGNNLYFGTGAGRPLIRRLTTARFIKIMSPFLPKPSDDKNSLFFKLLEAMRINRNLQISIVTKKKPDQINFIKAFISALNGEDYGDNIPAKQQRGFFQNLFRRPPEVAATKEKDYRSNRIKCFFIEDYNTGSDKSYNLHTKLYIVDNTELYFGSCNFDDNGIFNNLESSMQTSDPIVIKKMTDYYDEIVNRCIKDSV